MIDDKAFVEYIIKSIVNTPDKVELTRSVDELGVLLTVKVDATDMGLLIGRSGSTAKAIRTLARIIGMRNNARVNLKIEEPVGGKMYATQQKDKSVDDVVSEIGM